MAFVSSHIDLQNCLRFLTRAFVIFVLQDKVRKEKKIELPAEKSHNFLMGGIKRIRRQDIVQFSANLVQGLLTWNSKCTFNSPTFYFRKTGKI